ncbi:MAG: hypothetical protein LUF01_08760 [Bacteroides sp.]|nr:hypothetical protein [Bacteroides sp.]
MKTFKILTTWLMLLACCNLTSCSNDDDDEGGSTIGSIIGTWQYEEDDDYIETIEFRKDGTYKATSKEYYNGHWDTYTVKGDYEYKGNTITLYDEYGDSFSVQVISVTSKTLKISDEGEVITYHKI